MLVGVVPAAVTIAIAAAVAIATAAAAIAAVAVTIAVMPGITSKAERRKPRITEADVQEKARPVPEVIIPRIIPVPRITVEVGEVPAIPVRVVIDIDIVVVVLLHHDAVAVMSFVHRNLLIIRFPIRTNVAHLRIAACRKDQKRDTGQQPGFLRYRE